MSERVKTLICSYNDQGYSTTQISRILVSRHDIRFTRFAVLRFLKRRTCPKRKRTGPVKVSDIHYKALHLWIQENSEQTARVLQKRFKHVFGLDISISRVKVMRRRLGWTKVRRKYGQLISGKNRVLRVQWCLEMLARKETFHDVIFIDETCVEMQSSGRIFFYQKGSQIECPTTKVAKPKHPYKVNVWAGISYRGRTDLCIFTGVMDSVIYQQILARNLLPFAQARFPDGYRVYQDNDSKHKSKSTKLWMEENNMLEKVMVVPASSPDLNPIENVWGVMKDYLQRQIKPRTKDELVNGIRQYWKELTAEKCARFIDHIHKAIPKVVLNNGDQSGL